MQTNAIAEAIHVGTELLTFKDNTHTSLLAGTLAPLGIRMARAILVADDEKEIAEAITLALKRSSLVIVTGGLGPTFDDLSREAASRALGRKLTERPELVAKIKERFRQARFLMPVSNNRQAMVLEGAEVLENEAGSAPGQMVDLGGCLLVLLPGPPKELECTLAKALPLIRKKYFKEEVLVKTFHIAGMPESKVGEMAEPLLEVLSKDFVESTILASPYLIQLIFQVSGSQAEYTLDKIRRELGKIFGIDLVGEDGVTLEAKVGELLTSEKLTLAVAESCTGGMIADRITDVPGSSTYFLESVIAYSNETKKRVLGVPASVINQFGSVSAQAAGAMASGLLERSSSELTLSVTGICGPGGGTPEKPVGLCYFGLARRGRPVQICRRNFIGERLRLKERMSSFGLDLLRRHLLGAPLPGDLNKEKNLEDLSGQGAGQVKAEKRRHERQR